MTEKRFVWDCDGDTCHILDTVTKARYFYDGIDCLLNEQQATIQQLKAQLREKEADEKLYANEILELREINKEWLQCKNLGGDY